MGIPYSKEINIAFAQVTPLVAAGFQVLQTTKNISILLAVVQILTTVLLFLILLTLLGLICVVSPDLAVERDELVTPVVRWLAGWVLVYGAAVSWILRVGLVLGVSPTFMVHICVDTIHLRTILAKSPVANSLRYVVVPSSSQAFP